MRARLLLALAALILPWVFYATLPAPATITLDVLLSLLVGASMADALTPLGLLNFLVLQWFGVRVIRRYMDAHGLMFEVYRVGDRVGAMSSDGQRAFWRIVAQNDGCHIRLMRYGVTRWIWPLTGWWADYRWIARRP